MENHDESNVLQKHVMFFDRNNDGLIYPSETFQGFRAIGCGVLLSSVAAVFINLGLSRKTRPLSLLLHAVMENHDENNVLQKHVMFFDRNNDGLIYPSETFQGFRAIGCGVLLSSVAAVFINLGLSRKTRPGKAFSIHFPIEVKNIHLSKHTSDSGVYDKQGRFVPMKFEEIFLKHAHTHPHALTADELSNFMKSNREPKDYGGWLAASTEWKILYHLCKDDQGLLHKHTIRAVYDGSLFERLAKDHASKKNKITNAAAV